MYVRNFTKILILAAFFVPASCLAQTPAPAAPAKSPAKAPGKAAAKAPASTAPFDPALLHPETLKFKAPAEYDVKFVTTAGEFTMHVTRAWAPLGADRFYNLVRHHYYDGNAFFRVLSGFMAQFGMSPFPQVSAAWDNADIKDDPVVQSNNRGFVSFAMAGPNTRTTQLFINFGNNAPLDKSGFAPFAQVTDGMDVVDKLYNAYGEGAPDGRGPDQGLVMQQGRAYLEKNFPKLDVIKTARIIPPAAPATPAAPAAKAPAKTPPAKQQ
jgi:peptidyl-prolyl cis-trans isomerase A (cyclophilin A)